MPASEETVKELAERLCTLLNDCADAGVGMHRDALDSGRYTLAASGYHEGWKYGHCVFFDDEKDYWDVEGPGA
jgi:hypothetical protein